VHVASRRLGRVVTLDEWLEVRGGEALEPMEEALRRGHCEAIFPENPASITTDQLATLAVDAQQLHDAVGTAVAHLSGGDEGGADGGGGGGGGGGGPINEAGRMAHAEANVEDALDAEYPALPSDLSEPMIFLSGRQRLVAARYPALASLELPCWAPHRTVATALGHSHCGIEHALNHLGGKPYVWATEFENVHSLWRYPEPKIEVGGRRHKCSEVYYHSRKPSPYVNVVWCEQREAVMEEAVRAKLRADPALERLLLATHPHPLLSIKGDRVWGFCPREGQGMNLLARIWEHLREELREGLRVGGGVGGGGGRGGGGGGGGGSDGSRHHGHDPKGAVGGGGGGGGGAAGGGGWVDGGEGKEGKRKRGDDGAAASTGGATGGGGVAPTFRLHRIGRRRFFRRTDVANKDDTITLKPPVGGAQQSEKDEGDTPSDAEWFETRMRRAVDREVAAGAVWVQHARNEAFFFRLKGHGLSIEDKDASMQLGHPAGVNPSAIVSKEESGADMPWWQKRYAVLLKEHQGRDPKGVVGEGGGGGGGGAGGGRWVDGGVGGGGGSAVDHQKTKNKYT
jgi:predicted NAD-dependent protein-ADP-ribosyltransferase YbiA (DUF1768 family)